MRLEFACLTYKCQGFKRQNKGRKKGLSKVGGSDKNKHWKSGKTSLVELEYIPRE